MSKFYKTLCTILIVGFLTGSVAAQEGYWTARTDNSGLTRHKAVERITFPKEFKLFNLDIRSLRQQLFSIVGLNARRHSAIISLPNTEGKMEQFEVYEASNFEPELQAKFPETRAYSGRGVTDRYATLKLSISPQGIQTMVFRTEKENEFIEPYSADANVYAVFKSTREKGKLPWVCSTQDQEIAAGINSQLGNVQRIESNAGQLKTMRLAQSCNGEYSNWFGAFSVAQEALVLAAFNATLTRCNGCYEKDLALHLNLIPTTLQVIYYDPATDPYTTIGNWNSQLQSTLTAVIGEANYDIGHMFGASGGGGNAGCIGCVCVDGIKGSGITSPSDGIPQGDNFDIDYVAHEVGHQLGGNHTFSFTTQSGLQPVEVGSGITIMGYAGLTSQDVAPHSIDIFHERSIQQIQANLAGKICPVTTNISASNATPVVAPVANSTIPMQTPFALTGAATDANGDPLTYCWEQNDNGNGTVTGNNSVAFPAKMVGPNWLTFPATSSPIRYFPALQTILAGLQVTPCLPGGDAVANTEALSSVARTLNFRLTVRDNCPYSSTAPIKVGQTQFTDMTVTVVTSSGPFQVTSPNTNVSWIVGSTQTITWDVNNTTAAPVSCANVNILISTDGGFNFSMLLANTPNDGSENVVMPNTVTSTARIKVESVGNIFFDISNANFNIIIPPNGFTFNSPAPVLSSCPVGATMQTSLTATYTGSFTGNISLSATVNPAGPAVTFGTNPLTTATPTTTVTLNGTNTLPPGNYVVTVTGTGAGVPDQTRNITFTINPGAGPGITTQPVSQTVCSGAAATFTVAATGAVSYQWEVSTDGGATYSPIAGATAAAYTIGSTTTAMNNNHYRCVVNGACPPAAISNAAVLTIPSLPTISAQPQNARICEGGSHTFGVTATTGAGVLTYQWQSSIDGGVTYIDIPGATQTTLTVAQVAALADNYRYRVIITAGCGSVTSDEAILTVDIYPVLDLSKIPSVICKSDPALTLTGSPANGTFSGAGVSGSLFNPSVAGIGAIPVSYSASNAGCASSATKVIQVNDCKERHLLLHQYPAVIVYPTPNNGNFNIRLNTDLYSSISMRIFDSRGALVRSASYSGLSYGTVIPVSLGTHLQNGVYHIYLVSNDGPKSSRGVSIIVSR